MINCLEKEEEEYISEANAEYERIKRAFPHTRSAPRAIVESTSILRAKFHGIRWTLSSPR